MERAHVSHAAVIQRGGGISRSAAFCVLPGAYVRTHTAPATLHLSDVARWSCCTLPHGLCYTHQHPLPRPRPSPAHHQSPHTSASNACAVLCCALCLCLCVTLAASGSRFPSRPFPRQATSTRCTLTTTCASARGTRAPYSWRAGQSSSRRSSSNYTQSGVGWGTALQHSTAWVRPGTLLEV